MATITHTASDKSYSLKLHGKKIAEAVKTSEGFQLVWAALKPLEDTFKTMASLKVALEEEFPTLDKAELVEEKPKNLSLPAALRKLGVSHNGMWQYADRVRAIWPHLPAHLYGDRAFRLGMMAQAQWPYGGKAREWLAANPTVGAFDLDDYRERTIALWGKDEADYVNEAAQKAAWEDAYEA